jgi:hypothetical protein
MSRRRLTQTGQMLGTVLVLAVIALPSPAQARKAKPRPATEPAAEPAPPAPASEPATLDKRPNPHADSGLPNPFGSKVSSGLPNPYGDANRPSDGPIWGFASIGPLAAYMNRDGERWEGGGELSIWFGSTRGSRAILGRSLLGIDAALTTTRFFSELQACYFPLGISLGVVHNFAGFSATGFQTTLWVTSLFIVPFFQMDVFADRLVFGGGVSLKVPFFVSSNAPGLR